MSDTAAESTSTQDSEAPAQEADEQAKPDIDWKAKAREWEKRAKDNKAAADRLAELEEAQKTEAQKAADRLAAAEKEATEARNEALRYKIATEFRLSADDAEALEHISSEDGMRLVAQRLSERAEEAGKPRAPRPDPNQGRQSGGTASTAEQFAAAIEGQFTR